jgi:hypothetical protein
MCVIISDAGDESQLRRCLAGETPKTEQQQQQEQQQRYIPANYGTHIGVGLGCALLP